MGLHASALTVGNAVGAPLVGLIVDRTSPRAGFIGIGALGAALAGLALAAVAGAARRRAPAAAPREPVASER
jgi:predicted MFS family arabinose efflux permease